jgi:hypothetical protein
MVIMVNGHYNDDNFDIRMWYAPNEADIAYRLNKIFESIARKADMFNGYYIGTDEATGLQVQGYYGYEDIDYIDDNIVRDGISQVLEFDEYDLSLKLYTDRMIVRELYW